MKKPTKLSPAKCRSHLDVCRLARDNYDTESGWILADHAEVTIAIQTSGEEPKESVTVPKAEFAKMVRWWLREQRLPNKATERP